MVLETIDVAMPYYGDVGMMQQAVRSVIAQTDQNWRLIVTDDGSEPGVPEWFASLEDSRIDYRRNDHRLGVTKNYQKVLSLVENPLLVFMGGDDVMLPHYLATVRDCLREFPDAKIVQPGVQVIDTAGNPAMPFVDQVKRHLFAPKAQGRRLYGGEDLAVGLIRGNWLYFPSLAWRSDIAKKVGFPDDLDEVHDLAMVIDALCLHATMVVDDTVCFRYRRHAVSHSSAAATSGRRFVTERTYFTGMIERFEALGWHRAAAAARNHIGSRLHALTLVPKAVRRGDKGGVRNLTRHAFGNPRAH
ncbi:glycosyltransferase family 2 protein [Embleya sp. NPDC127516]|uniref:glycosyltransferase family 2 protein n=1 Tax=Embleya sp. NPDC127516 TaxID=3363990 RepID=UPI0037F8C1C0